MSLCESGIDGLCLIVIIIYNILKHSHNNRTIVCWAFKNITTNKLVDYARQEARITHYHPDAGNCSGVMVLLCRYLLEEYSWDESKDLVSKNDEVKTTWINIQNANLNNGGFVLDVMHSAFHFLDREDSLNNSLTFVGC